MDEQIMRRLTVQNKSFDFKGWRIISNKRDLRGDGRIITMEMPQEAIDQLEINNFYLAYALTQVRFVLLKGTSGGNSANTVDPNLDDRMVVELTGSEKQ
jgi:hypothetical protein